MSALPNSGLGPRIVRNAGAVVVGRVLSLAIALIPGVLLARYLGSRDLGQYAALYAYASLFAWIATFGLEQILVQTAAQEPAEAGRLIGSGVTLSFVFSAGAAGAALLISPLSGYHGREVWLLAWACVEIVLLSPLRLASSVFQVALRQEIPATIAVLRQVAWLCGLLLLILLHASLPAIVLARTATAVAEALALLTSARRILRFALGWDARVMRQLLRRTAPMGLAVAGVAVEQRIDQVLLHAWSGNQELGYYAAAVNLTEVFVIIPSALTATLLPVLASRFGNEAAYMRLLGRCYRFLATVSIAICLALWSGAHVIVSALYGPAFTPSAQILGVLAWSLLAIYLGGTLTMALIAGNRQALVPLGALAAATLNIGLNAYLIPRRGAVGAAWATSISYSVGNFALYVLLPATRAISWPGVKALAAPGGALLVAILAALLVPLPLKPVAALLAYAAVLWLLGGWEVGDLRELLRMLRARWLPAGSSVT